MADLYLMCGIPGSGKSTWLKNHLKPEVKNHIVSRDEIRFSLLKDGEDYFSKEEEVYKQFWHDISSYLNEGYNVFADQTSLTPKSRKYLIDHVSGYDNINAIWMNTPTEVALARNENRKGRAHVPKTAIINMSKRFTIPSFEEGYNMIVEVEDKSMKIRKKGQNYDLLHIRSPFFS